MIHVLRARLKVAKLELELRERSSRTVSCDFAAGAAEIH